MSMGYDTSWLFPFLGYATVLLNGQDYWVDTIHDALAKIIIARQWCHAMFRKFAEVLCSGLLCAVFLVIPAIPERFSTRSE